MRRVKLRTVLALTALAGAGVALALALAGPWSHKTAALIEETGALAAESVTDAGLDLQALTVEGREKTAREDLLAALDVERGTPILSIEVAAAREAIESLPWVKTAKIERRLPGGVHIMLDEYEPYALWQRDGHYTLVARDGAEIIDVHGNDRSLPLIVGPDAPVHAAAFFKTLASTNPDLAARVVAAVRVGGRRWNVHFDDYEGGVAVRLPEDDVALTWTRLADLERDYRILERDLAFIDMRVEGQLIVRINKQTEEDASPKAATEFRIPETAVGQEI